MKTKPGDIIYHDADKFDEIVETCPECKTKETTYYMDNDGVFHCECFDCEHKWLVKRV